jgi:hypothetical protein
MQRNPEHVLASIRKYKVKERRMYTYIYIYIYCVDVVHITVVSSIVVVSSHLAYLCLRYVRLFPLCMHAMQGDGVKPGHRTLEWDNEMLSTLDCVQLATDFNGIVVRVLVERTTDTTGKEGGPSTSTCWGIET